tara:strand:+ start:291 stop:512 length:222 start_codon:yes stop_codon:yes gene_type:complete
MSNMSYCRFHNTNLDLQDCIDYAEELINNNGKDEDNEPLSKMEMDAMHDMIDKAQYYTEIGEQLADILYNQNN